MSVLAHAFEKAGIATVALGSIRRQVEEMNVPRGMWCDFPLGRPLGVPNDAEFQHRVIAKGFEMLAATEATFTVYDEVVPDDSDTPLSCAMPPRFDANEHPAVDEARALRGAYDRAVAEHGNRIGACREITADQIPEAVAAWVKVAEGTSWKEAGIPGQPMRVNQDIRGYYQTAALALADHTPGAWAAESWFFEETEMGKLLLQARATMRDAGEKQGAWFYLAPGDR